MLQMIVTLRALAGRLTDRVHDEDLGASMVEYGLLVVGIAVVVGVAALALGGRIALMFTNLPI